LEDTLEGINELYKSGAFKRFGLSNFKPEEVEQIVSIAKERGYVVPSVYQGNYSAVARRIEKDIFPVLRKHNFSFYAYSPIAGGFLTKTSDQIRNGGTGRFDTSTKGGQMYSSMYGKPTLLEALDTWNQIAKDEGISKSELSYRWITHNSALRGELGDAVIIGAKTVEHLRDTMAGIRNGPLSAGVAKKIDEIWEHIAADAPLDNYHR
jgi:aflatoxin B1 aldehyde reductase